MHERIDNEPAEYIKHYSDEQVKKQSSGERIEMPDTLETCNNKIRSEEKGKRIDNTAKQPVLIIFANESVELFDKQLITILHNDDCERNANLAIKRWKGADIGKGLHVKS
jgi:hypothetical protein